MEVKNFSIKEALQFGWTKMKDNFGFLLLVFLIYYAISMLPTATRRDGFFFSALSLAAYIVTLIMQMGIIQMALRLYENKKAELKELFPTKNLFNFFLGTILYALIVVAGLILLVVPGIYWAIKYQFTPWLIAEKGMEPINALKKSGEMTKGVKWPLFGWYLVTLGINLLGMAILGVGLLITVPTTFLAYAFIYKKLEVQEKI